MTDIIDVLYELSIGGVDMQIESVPLSDSENRKAFFLQNLIRVSFFAVILLTLADLCIKDTPPDYVYGTMNSSTISNTVFVVLAVLALAGFSMLYVFVRPRLHLTRTFAYSLLAAGFVVLLVLQIVLAKQIYFISDWDIGVVESKALEIAKTGIQPLFSGYLQMYPNNILLTLLLSGVMKASIAMRIDPYFGCIVFNILLIDLAGYFSIRCIHQLTKSLAAMLGGFLLFATLVGLSAWMVIPYSDTVSMFAPILAFSLFLDTQNEKRLFRKWIGIVCVSIFGALIKPTCIIVLIAIYLLHLVSGLRTKRPHAVKYTLLPFGILLSILILLVGGYQAAARVTGKSLNPDSSLPYTHFLMMGLNPVTYGTFAPVDAEVTLTAKTREERQQKNWNLIGIRLRNYGFVGYLDFLSNKHLVNFNDGTFAWGREGVFYAQVLPASSGFSTALREFYYSTGSKHSHYANIMQSLWVFVLVSLLGLPLFHRKADLLQTTCIMLTILGITLFLSLFESRARYLLCNIPFFLIGATLGARGLFLALARAVARKDNPAPTKE